MIIFAIICLLFFGISSQSAIPSITVVSNHNNSEIYLRCQPAEMFVQTHMAPDFESPQLVRRVDWFHEDQLVASYQQNVIEDTSRQWWVSDGRYQLIRPFYALRVGNVLPEDAGMYRCRLETDPLFALSMSTANVELAVMVRPTAPSSPEIRQVTNRSVTLKWQHNTAKSHRPILRYSILVRSIADDNRFTMAAPSNATSVIVDNLSPFTLYAFAIKGENAAGESEFGPETKQRTLGDAPSTPPRIVSLHNTSNGCVALNVAPPESMHGDLGGYTVELLKAYDKQPRKEFFAGSATQPFLLCALSAHSLYELQIKADNEFGSSPVVTKAFYSEEQAPESPPSDISVLPIVGKAEIKVLWTAPSSENGIITQYDVLYKTNKSEDWSSDIVKTRSKHREKHWHIVKHLEAATDYIVKMTASTSKAQSRSSDEFTVKTDVPVPSPVEIVRLKVECDNKVHVEWKNEQHSSSVNYFVNIRNSTMNKSLNVTKTTIDFQRLLPQEEYRVKIRAVVRSLVDGSLLEGPFGKEHSFIIGDHCIYQASICEPGSKCLQLVQHSSVSTYSLPIAAVSVLLFAMLVILVAYVLKGRTFGLKELLKKKEKCVYLEELTPLVYDSVGCEDIPVELFYSYCDDLARNECAKYKMQFEHIENTTNSECTQQDSLEKNLDKNRYLNIGAIEATRIRITNSTNGSDYINANYIDSCEKRNAYIATQAPLPSTFADFWQMIWQERCNVIIVITNLVEDGRRKCDQYWPSTVDGNQMHGTYQVTLAKETINAHFIHRILQLKIAKSVPPAERKIHQLHFTGWPDHGVPTSVFPLLTFMNYASDINAAGPVVVHCSAGVGRSGSFMLIDSMRRHLVNNRRLNVMGHLIHMRKQREKLVQTIDQYILCHEAIRQLIRHGITRVHSDLFPRYLSYLSEENVVGKSRMQMQFEDLCECAHDRKCTAMPEVAILPGYHRLDEFIVVNWPTENEDLWRLVWKRNCQTIVSLGDESYWTGISEVDGMTIVHDDQFVLLQNKEDQLCVRIVLVCQQTLEADLWCEIERIQQLRLAYHDAPLLVLNPHGAHSPSPRPQNGTLKKYVAEQRLSTSSNNTIRSSPLSLSMFAYEPLPSLAYSICALTSLACQLEQESCVDVVQILALYSHIQCGIWQTRGEIEFIYDKLSLLVSGSRV